MTMQISLIQPIGQDVVHVTPSGDSAFKPIASPETIARFQRLLDSQSPMPHDSDGEILAVAPHTAERKADALDREAKLSQAPALQYDTAVMGNPLPLGKSNSSIDAPVAPSPLEALESPFRTQEAPVIPSPIASAASKTAFSATTTSVPKASAPMVSAQKAPLQLVVTAPDTTRKTFHYVVAEQPAVVITSHTFVAPAPQSCTVFPPLMEKTFRTKETPLSQASAVSSSVSLAVSAPMAEATMVKAPVVSSLVATTFSSPTISTPVAQVATVVLDNLEALEKGSRTMEAPVFSAPTASAPTASAPTASAPTASAPAVQASTVVLDNLEALEALDALEKGNKTIEAPVVSSPVAPTISAPVVSTPSAQTTTYSAAPTPVVSTPAAQTTTYTVNPTANIAAQQPLEMQKAQANPAVQAPAAIRPRKRQTEETAANSTIAQPYQPIQTFAAAISQEIAAAGMEKATPSRTQVVLDVVESVCDVLMVSPGLLRGEGTIRLQLKNEVLDGSEITLEAKGRTLSISFQPATMEAQQILERNVTQLEQHLAGRIYNYQIAVAIKKGKHNERI